MSHRLPELTGNAKTIRDKLKQIGTPEWPRVRAALASDRPKTVAVAAFSALGSLWLYLRTLVPGVYVSDFAEFQYQPLRLGLPHPNGFPFYMLLGWLWSHLPMGSVAWRMNALSAIGGALAVA